MANQVSPVSNSEVTCSSFYLPHHGVVKNKSFTTKVRNVFDGSMRTSKGISLNDILKVGPVIQPNLSSIPLRFREYAFVFSADSCQMYGKIPVLRS